MGVQYECGDWRSEFTADELAAIRSLVPQAIQQSQERSARAQAEFADPDGDQDVYGAGMARGVQKEVRALLAPLPSYREMPVSGTRRMLTFLGDALIFPHRVGKQMRRNHLRVRLDDLSEARRELLQKTSNVKYAAPGLFDLEDESGGDEPARFDDAFALVAEGSARTTLFVPYYSSTAQGVGTVYFAPARLNGKYLEFTDPERLTYQQVPAALEQAGTVLKPVAGFAEGARPRTSVKLRSRSSQEEDS